jgi:Alw26I/Eco31I/Esp3I family type II restriction m6 adenine DNA methyltransferase
MSAPTPLETQLLAPSEAILSTLLLEIPEAKRDEARYQLLEAVAANYGQFSPDIFRKISPSAAFFSPVKLRKASECLLDSLKAHQISVPLALTSLARPDLNRHQRRKDGVYYTDFRLASLLASRFTSMAPGAKIVDPAAGSGILLVASVQALFPKHGRERDAFLISGVFAADLSALALRGALLSLASLASSSEVVAKLSENLRCADSLELKKSLWRDVAPDGFDLVVGNPPWEKLKVTAHEVLQENGVSRHYGQGYHALAEYRKPIQDAKLLRQDYLSKLRGQYHFQGDGEPDLYKFFIELSVELCRPGGQLALIVPGGLIRSQGTHALRKFLSESASAVSYTIFDNKSRFFAIDTRFKFLLVEAEMDQAAPAEIRISHGKGTQFGIDTIVAAKFPASDLKMVRPDLSVPEVRSDSEWSLFRKLACTHPRFGSEDGGWYPRFCREVDMTRDKGNFERNSGKGRLPLIEGRMVHQFHGATKAYVSGQGRSADWRSTYFDPKIELNPQFWYSEDLLPPAVRERTKVRRVGFCDITGQTNERSMLASWIPQNVVCGNKVPTILFGESEQSETLGNAWLGLANSFVFDWLLRRVLTTTVNYFLLLDLPIPKADLSNKLLLELAYISEKITNISPSLSWEYAGLRAEADLLVAALYGVTPSDLELIFNDFPLMDRTQSALPGEGRSTVTRDHVLSLVLKRLKMKLKVDFLARYEAAKKLGAIPYVPSHLEGSGEGVNRGQ